MISYLYPSEEKREEVIAEVMRKVSEIEAFENTLNTEIRSSIDNSTEEDLGAIASTVETLENAVNVVLGKSQALTSLIHQKITESQTVVIEPDPDEEPVIEPDPAEDPVVDPETVVI